MPREITPETVAAMLAETDDDLHDGNGWWPSLLARGNVVEIGITPVSDDYEAEEEDEIQLRAVVVTGDQAPIVLDRPVIPGLMDAGKPLTDLSVEDGHVVSRDNCWACGEMGVLRWTPADARELAAHLAAFADQAEGEA